MEQPIAYWVPSISPSGMTVYRGKAIPEWKGDIFFANLSSSHLRRLRYEKGKIIDQQELYKGMDERIRQVAGGPDGRLYFSTDSGMIYALSKK
jgi:glucose/arabinose dehydrogenase